MESNSEKLGRVGVVDGYLHVYIFGWNVLASLAGLDRVIGSRLFVFQALSSFILLTSRLTKNTHTHKINERKGMGSFSGVFFFL